MKRSGLVAELLQIRAQARLRQAIVQQQSSSQKQNDRMQNRNPLKT
jgi:hypothetical protein